MMELARLGLPTAVHVHRPLLQLWGQLKRLGWVCSPQ